MEIEKNYGYSLDWIYGLSEIMVDRYTQELKIESKKMLIKEKEKLVAKDKDVLTITLSGNQLNLLNCIRKIKHHKVEQTISYIECEELMYKYEQEFKDRIYSVGKYIEIPEHTDIVMDEFKSYKTSKRK